MYPAPLYNSLYYSIFYELKQAKTPLFIKVQGDFSKDFFNPKTTYCVIFLPMIEYKDYIGVVNFDPGADKILGMQTLFFIQGGSLFAEVFIA